MPAWGLRRGSWRGLLLGALLPVLAQPLAGHAQVESREGIALQNQMYELQQQLRVLRSDVDRNANSGGGGGGGGGGGDIAGQLVTRVQALEEQVRQLRGRIDETQNMIARQNADLSKRLDDLTFQLNLRQGTASGAPTAPLAGAQLPTPPPVREVAPKPMPEFPRVAEAPKPDTPPRLALQPNLPTVIPPPRSPPPTSFTFGQPAEPGREAASPPPPAKPPAREAEAVPPKPPGPAYTEQNPLADAAAQIPLNGKTKLDQTLQEGHAALARRDYAAAEKAAREVVANRTSPKAYDGQLLLAQALVGEKQYAQAAIAFDDTYNRSRKGRHAEDALVGLATALTAINEKKAACDTLGKLRTEFPEVRADLRETITRTNDRAGCAR